MSAAPPFEPLNDLERLLVRAATEADQRPAFTQALLDSQLYAVTPDPGPEGPRTAGEGESISLVMVPLEDGGQATAVFTAAERVGQVYGEGSHYIALRGRDLIGMVAANPMLLNPGLSYGVLWSREDLALLLGRPVERVVEKATQFMLGHPAEEPADLVRRLKAAFQPEHGVTAAWLGLAHWAEQDEFAWYFDVRSNLPHEELRELLGKAIHRADMRGIHLDMAVNPPGGDAGTGIPIVGR